MSGRSAMMRKPFDSRRLVVSWPAPNRKAPRPVTSTSDGCEPSGNFASASSVRISSLSS
jgi:hypothetical protein